jgi:hypothetical protein
MALAAALGGLVATAIVGPSLAGGRQLVAAAFLFMPQLVFIPQLVGDGVDTIADIDELTRRQQVTAPQSLGRVGGGSPVLLEGVGADRRTGRRCARRRPGSGAAIGVSVVGSWLSVGFLWFSPVRRLGGRVASP